MQVQPTRRSPVVSPQRPILRTLVRHATHPLPVRGGLAVAVKLVHRAESQWHTERNDLLVGVQNENGLVWLKADDALDCREANHWVYCLGF